MEVTVRGPHRRLFLCPPGSSAHGAPVPEVSVHIHPHAGRRPAALLNGRRGNPEPAAGRPGNPAGGVGQPARPAGSKDGPHRGHHPGMTVAVQTRSIHKSCSFRQKSLSHLTRPPPWLLHSAFSDAWQFGAAL